MAMESAVSVIRRELSNLRKQVDSLRHMMKSEVTKLKQLLLLQRQTNGSRPALETLTDCTSGSTQTSGQLQRGRPKGSDKTLSALSGMAVGWMRSCFKEKNGTPRQPGLCSKATGSLTVETFNNPRHSLEGLEEYSHIWLLFVFHKNVQDSTKAKVRPPCLNGRKVGVFASRSPHRPCPIGLTLAKLESIEGDTLHLSGIDLIDGTPVLDVKPYIPGYDSLKLHTHPVGSDRELRSSPVREESTGGMESKADFTDGQIQTEAGNLHPEVKIASWLEQRPVSLLEVEFSPQAEEQLKRFRCKKSAPPTYSETNLVSEECQRECGKNDESCITARGCSSEGLDSSGKEDFPKFEENSSHSATNITTSDANGSESAYFIDSFTSIEDAKEAIIEMLQQDTRSVYRRTKCPDQSYKVSIDNLNLTCQFRDERIIVMTVEPKILWEQRMLQD